MEIRPNLENLSEDEFYHLMINMLKNIDKTLNETTEKLKVTLDYLEHQDRIREIYSNFDTNYCAQLN